MRRALVVALLLACRNEAPRAGDPATVSADAAPRPPANLRHVELRVLGMT